MKQFMMFSRWVVGCVGAAALLVAQWAEATDVTYTWTGGGSDTSYTNTANWNMGVVPTNNQTGAFSSPGQVTVTFPGGGYEDKSETEITLTDSITFNTVGTYWRKSINTVNWGTPFRVGGGAHGFNIEGTGNNKAQMLMSNAVFKATLSATAITNTLQSGLLNFYDPDGTLSGNRVVLGHDSNRSHYIGLEAGSTSRWNNIEFRGLGPDNMLRVSGGYHEVLGSLTVGASASAQTAVVDVAGGYLMISSNKDTHIGYRGAGNIGPGVLQVSGGTISQLPGGNGTVFVGSTSPGQVNVTAGYFSAKNWAFYLGNNRNGSLTVSGGAWDSRFFRAGSASGATGTVVMTGGVWTNTALVYLGAGAGAVGQVTNSGGTIISLANAAFNVGNDANSVGELVMQSGSLTMNNNGLTVGNAASSTGTVTLAGGTVTATSIARGSGYATLIANGGVLKALSASHDIVNNMNVAQLGANGLTVDTAGLDVSMSQAFSDYPGSSGTLVKRGAGTLTLSGTNAYSGTTVVSNGVLKLGNANAITNTGAIAVAGGTLDLGGFTVTNGAVTLSAGSIINGTMQASALDISGAGLIGYSATLAASSLTMSGSGTADMYNNFGNIGSTYVNAGTLSLAPVPSVMSDCIAWFDSSDAGTLTTNGSGYVTNWTNKGSAGAALDAVQITPGSGPKVLPNDLNGKSALNLENTAGLKTKANVGIVGGQDRTMFVVGCRTTSGHFYMAQAGVFGANNVWFGIRNGSDWLNCGTYGADIYLPPQPTNLYVICDFMIANNRGTANLISNGVFSTSSATLAPNTTDAPLCLGSQTHLANSGKLAEVIVFNRALTLQERQTVESYLKVKWFGPPVVLPATTRVAVASGATLNLGGNSSTVAELSGGGTVTNGTLTVTGALSLTNGAPGTLTIATNLTLAAGAAIQLDYNSSTSDTVRVTGALTLQGANAVTLNAIGSVAPPGRVTLFTYGTLLGAANLSSWTVTGPRLGGYTPIIGYDANSVYVDIRAMGTGVLLY